jgi:hypothetical protein
MKGLSESQEIEYDVLHAIVQNLKFDAVDLTKFPNSWEVKILMRYFRLSKIKTDHYLYEQGMTAGEKLSTMIL